MKPSLPLISVYRENGIDIINGEYPLDQTTLYGFIKHNAEEGIYYDKDGFKWTSAINSRKFKSSFLTKLLANTFYNPTIKVERSWTKIGWYELPELIGKVNNCLDVDDDVLTQFIGASDLKQKMKQLNSFDELVKLLLENVFKPSKDVISKIA